MEKEDKRRKVIRRSIYFSLPIVIMTVVFIALHMSPFGTSSLLTYDLSEQYVDFFEFYRNTLLHHPSQLIYSFTNGIGGETIGLWAYYLLSPFNLILLFFSKANMPIGILVVTLIKYGCAGLTFGYCMEKLEWTSNNWTPMATVCYALMGWIIANEFNIMWLDALIFLPFVILGIEKIYNKNQSFLYTISLALILFINFYMGYMICIFIILYFVWITVREWTGWKNFSEKFFRWSISSILAAGSVAFLLLPTYFDITKSKGVYTQHSVSFSIEYAPWKMLSKFMIGALNDNQVQGGLPNLFVGSFVLAGFILYFMARKIPWKEKIASSIVSVIMTLAMCWRPLDIIWHAFQSPIDYPYRFSFIVSTWMILLAVRGLTQIGKPKIYQLLIAFVIPIGCWIFVFVKHKKFDYLTNSNMITTLIFMIVIFALMIPIIIQQNEKTCSIKLQYIIEILILSFTCVECGYNGYQMLKTLSYASENSYTDFVTNLNYDIDWIRAHEKTSNFYRIGKTFQRSENDSLNAGYYGMSGFSSTQDVATTSFMGAMGNPTYLGKESYTEGSLLVDSIMGVKYFIAPTDQFSNLTSGSIVTPASSYRPDISFYNPIKQKNGITIYQNPNALSLGFAANKKVISIKDFPSGDYTADNQSFLLNKISGLNQKYFNTVNFDAKLINCKLNEGLNRTLETIDKNKPSKYEINLDNVSASPYYLQLTTDIMWNSSVTINGNEVPGFSVGCQPLINICANVPEQPIKIDITPNNGTQLNLNDLKVYEFNISNFEKAMSSISNNQLELTHNGKLQLSGNIDMPGGQKDVMMTTIPYNKGWTSMVDGHKVKTEKAFNTFLAIHVPKGKHQIQLSFWPPLLTLGIVVTLITWIILILCWKYENKEL